MGEYRKRIEKLKYEIFDLEKELERAKRHNKSYLTRRLELIIGEKKDKIKKWSKL